jgi:ABC-2 type transport system permease protein
MNTVVSQDVSLQPGPPSMSRKRLIRAYLKEVKFEFIGAFRTIAFSVPFLLLPVLVYLLFGVAMSADSDGKTPNLGSFLFCGFSVFAVTGPAIFGVGCGIAIERDAGLMKLKRALPVPAGASLIAKMLMAMSFAAITFCSLLVPALIFGKLTISAWQILGLGGLMVVGAVPFCALGLMIGAYVSGSAAPAVANLIYLPMMWLGALFIPLPKFLQPQAVIWPSFHLNQLAVSIAGLKEYHYVSTSVSIAVLAGVTILFGALALHKLAQKG